MYGGAEGEVYLHPPSLHCCLIKIKPHLETSSQITAHCGGEERYCLEMRLSFAKRDSGGRRRSSSWTEDLRLAPIDSLVQRESPVITKTPLTEITFFPNMWDKGEVRRGKSDTEMQQATAASSLQQRKKEEGGESCVRSKVKKMQSSPRTKGRKEQTNTFLPYFWIIQSWIVGTIIIIDRYLRSTWLFLDFMKKDTSRFCACFHRAFLGCEPAEREEPRWHGFPLFQILILMGT